MKFKVEYDTRLSGKGIKKFDSLRKAQKFAAMLANTGAFNVVVSER